MCHQTSMSHVSGLGDQQQSTESQNLHPSVSMQSNTEAYPYYSAPSAATGVGHHGYQLPYGAPVNDAYKTEHAIDDSEYYRSGHLGEMYHTDVPVPAAYYQPAPPPPPPPPPPSMLATDNYHHPPYYGDYGGHPPDASTRHLMSGGGPIYEGLYDGYYGRSGAMATPMSMAQSHHLPPDSWYYPPHHHLQHPSHSMDHRSGPAGPDHMLNMMYVLPNQLFNIIFLCHSF